MALKVRGRTYDSPAELADAIAELEELRDAEVDDLRERGADARADARADAYEADLHAMRASLREANEKAAAATEQPPNRPRRASGSSPGQRRGPGRRSSGGGRAGGQRPAAGDRVIRELAWSARCDVGCFTEKSGIAPYTG